MSGQTGGGGRCALIWEWTVKSHTLKKKKNLGCLSMWRSAESPSRGLVNFPTKFHYCTWTQAGKAAENRSWRKWTVNSGTFLCVPPANDKSKGKKWACFYTKLKLIRVKIHNKQTPNAPQASLSSEIIQLIQIQRHLSKVWLTISFLSSTKFKIINMVYTILKMNYSL